MPGDYINITLLNTTQEEVLATATPDGAMACYVSPTVNGHTVIYPDVDPVNGEHHAAGLINHWIDDVNRPLFVSNVSYGTNARFEWHFHYSNHHSIGVLCLTIPVPDRPWIISFFDKRRFYSERYIPLPWFAKRLAYDMGQPVNISITPDEIEQKLEKTAQGMRSSEVATQHYHLDDILQTILMLYDLPPFAYRMGYNDLQTIIPMFGGVTLDGFRHVQLPYS